MTFAHKTGCRVNEIVNLTWGQVNRKDWYVRIEGALTKNEEARTVSLDKELQEAFKSRWQMRKTGKRVTQYVFPNYIGHSKIGDFRTAWKPACEKAEVIRLVHVKGSLLILAISLS